MSLLKPVVGIVEVGVQVFAFAHLLTAVLMFLICLMVCAIGPAVTRRLKA